MHKLNFCTALCLRDKIEGYKARGINAVHEFDEGFVLPMAGIATPLHILYASRPITLFEGKILRFEDLDTKEKVDAAVDSHAIAPDFAVDLSPFYNPLVEHREKNLKHIVLRLFLEGHKKVVIWSNNGIGKTVDEESDGDGVLRDERNIAYTVRLNGEVSPYYQKGLEGSYQNTAHDHIHIAPDTTGFYEKLLKVLEEIHSKPIRDDSFGGIRGMAWSQEFACIPCISLCVVDWKTRLSQPLMHTFYPGWESNFPEGTNRAGFVRQLVTKASREAGIDFKDPETKKKYLDETAEVYRRILSKQLSDY
jgi:hypothetical protein